MMYSNDDDLLQGKEFGNQILKKTKKKKPISPTQSSVNGYLTSPPLDLDDDQQDLEMKKKRSSISKKTEKEKEVVVDDEEEETTTKKKVLKKKIKDDEVQEEEEKPKRRSSISKKKKDVVVEEDLDIVDQDSQPSIVTRKRRTKSIGGAVVTGSTKQDKEELKYKSILDDLESHDIPPPTKGKRKSIDPYSTTHSLASNIFQSDRHKSSDGEEEEEEEVVEKSKKKVGKRKDYEVEDKDFKPVKEVKKKARFSTIGAKTQLERDKEKEEETKKRVQEERNLALKHRIEEINENRRKDAEVYEKEQQRQKSASERLQKLTQDRKIQQPTITINKPQPTTSSTRPPVASFLTPSTPITKQHHVYPKTPVGTKLGGSNTNRFPYTETPTQIQPPPSKPIFNNKSSNDSIDFDTDDHDIIDLQDNNNDTSIYQDEFGGGLGEGADTFDQDKYQQYLYQQNEQQYRNHQQQHPSTPPHHHSTSRSISSYLLTISSLIVWLLLFITLFNFYYHFNDIKYCDNDTIPRYINGKFSCQPCPDKAICFKGTFSCLDGYSRQDGHCIVDPNKIETMSTVLSKIDGLLRSHKGKFECSLTDRFDMPFDRLEFEFQRLFWIKKADITQSFHILVDYIDRHAGSIDDLGVDKKLINSISSSYDSTDQQYHYTTSNQSIKPLWCQTYHTFKSLIMEYIPLILSILTAYVLYRYYRYTLKKKAEEKLLIDECYKNLVAILQNRANYDVSWISELLLKDEIIGEDRSPKALRVWEMTLEKAYNNIKIFVAPRLVHGESQQTFEWRGDNLQTPIKHDHNPNSWN